MNTEEPLPVLRVVTESIIHATGDHSFFSVTTICGIVAYQDNMVWLTTPVNCLGCISGVANNPEKKGGTNG